MTAQHPACRSLCSPPETAEVDKPWTYNEKKNWIVRRWNGKQKKLLSPQLNWPGNRFHQTTRNFPDSKMSFFLLQFKVVHTWTTTEPVKLQQWVRPYTEYWYLSVYRGCCQAQRTSSFTKALRLRLKKATTSTMCPVVLPFLTSNKNKESDCVGGLLQKKPHPNSCQERKLGEETSFWWDFTTTVTISIFSSIILISRVFWSLFHCCETEKSNRKGLCFWNCFVVILKLPALEKLIFVLFFFLSAIDMLLFEK